MMPIHELYALKAEYEAELALAQAKVCVINDVIARATQYEVANAAPTQVAAEPVAEQEHYSVTDGNY